jgi:hypothetical protein
MLKSFHSLYHTQPQLKGSYRRPLGEIVTGSKEDKVWPAQAVKIEPVVSRAAVHDGMKRHQSPRRPSSRRPTTWTGTADSNPLLFARASGS